MSYATTENCVTVRNKTRRVAVRIAYCGASFHGSQRQPEARTVEGEIIASLLIISNGMSEDEIELKAASRTDAGVNALGNVVAFNTQFQNDEMLLDALNAISRDVFYLSLAELPRGYVIRHAWRRRYLYVLPSDKLDVSKIRQVADLIRGEHDFYRFCRDDGKSTVLLMEEVEVHEKEGLIEIHFAAPFFLWNLVRRLVAAMEKVGRGRVSIEDVARALEGEHILFGLARPDRLTLLDVEYEDLDFRPYHGLSLRRRAEEERLQALLSLRFHSTILS